MDTNTKTIHLYTTQDARTWLLTIKDGKGRLNRPIQLSQRQIDAVIDRALRGQKRGTAGWTSEHLDAPEIRWEIVA